MTTLSGGPTVDEAPPNPATQNSHAIPTGIQPHRETTVPDYIKLSGWPVWYPFDFILQYMFTAMCTISYGHRDLTKVLELCQPHDPWSERDERLWQERKDAFAKRIRNVCVVVSFPILSSELHSV